MSITDDLIALAVAAFATYSFVKLWGALQTSKRVMKQIEEDNTLLLAERARFQAERAQEADPNRVVPPSPLNDADRPRPDPSVPVTVQGSYGSQDIPPAVLFVQETPVGRRRALAGTVLIRNRDLWHGIEGCPLTDASVLLWLNTGVVVPVPQETLDQVDQRLERAQASVERSLQSANESMTRMMAQANQRMNVSLHRSLESLTRSMQGFSDIARSAPNWITETRITVTGPDPISPAPAQNPSPPTTPTEPKSRYELLMGDDDLV